jgi:hypothetical protein
MKLSLFNMLENNYKINRVPEDKKLHIDNARKYVQHIQTHTHRHTHTHTHTRTHTHSDGKQNLWLRKQTLFTEYLSSASSSHPNFPLVT